MTGLRITVAAVGVVVAFIGGMLVISGADNLTSSARDADGYIMFDPATFASASAAIVIEDIDVLQGRFLVHAGDSGVPTWAIVDLDVRMHGNTEGPGALFMGVAASTAVDAYLDGVAYDEITDLDLDVGNVRSVEYTRHEGSGTPDAPNTQTFWETSVEGSGPLTLDWTVQPGNSTAVVMNADASNGVTAELVFGAQASNIDAIAWTKITIGLILLVAGGLAVFFGLRRRNRHSTSLPTDSPGEKSAAQAESVNLDPHNHELSPRKRNPRSAGDASESSAWGLRKKGSDFVPARRRWCAWRGTRGPPWIPDAIRADGILGPSC